MRTGVTALLMMTASLGAACHVTGGATFLVALGARDHLPTWQGACNVSTARPSGLLEFGDSGATYRAVKPGSVTIACEKGKLVLDVREVASLAIEGPDELGARFAAFKAVAKDRSGQSLTLGHYADVMWTTPPSIERQDGCRGDIVPTCLGADGVQLRAVSGAEAAAGVAEVVVSFGGKTATKKLTLK